MKFLIWPGFILLLIAQWWVPLQMIADKENVLAKGTSYKFETAPVDPSDPFRGKYIQLNFKETGLKFKGKQNLPYNSKVYVTFLKSNNGFAKVGSIGRKQPKSSDYLETTISYISAEKDSTAIYLNYPFTRYYMEEYKAPEAETIYRQSRPDTTFKTYALVSIYNGDAVIKNVYINDTSINEMILKRNVVR